VKGKNVDKKIAPSERGIIMELREEPTVVDLSLLRKLSDVIESAAAKKIVYVGEYHDRFSNHAVQLQIIRALQPGTPGCHRHGDVPAAFPKDPDDYGGAIDEQEFLNRSEYFKRWDSATTCTNLSHCPAESRPSHCPEPEKRDHRKGVQRRHGRAHR
jgi:hypothetical protein